MQFKYFATNKIPIDSEEDAKKYLSLCAGYFHTPISPYCSIPPKYQGENERDLKRIADLFKDGSRLSSEFEVTQLKHIGFFVKILYDEREKSFKLRLYYEKGLEDRNLSFLFEPMMVQLTTGPRACNLQVHRINEQLGVAEHPISYEEVRRHLSTARIKHNVNDLRIPRKAIRSLDQKIDKIEKVEGTVESEEPHSSGWLGLMEERRYNQDDRERRENEIKRVLIANYYQNRYPLYQELLRQKTDTFKKVRDDFIRKLPEHNSKIQDVAFGTFPYLHNEEIFSHFGTLFKVDNLLPFSQGFSFLGETSLIDAEIFERALGDCNWVLSLFPYTSHIPVVNDLTETLLKEDEILEAMIAHELGERIMTDGSGMLVTSLRMMCDPMYAEMIRQKQKEHQDENHRNIDELLNRIGYGEQNRKMAERYGKAAADLKTGCKQCGKSELLLHPEELPHEQWFKFFNWCFSDKCANNPFKLQKTRSIKP